MLRPYISGPLGLGSYAAQPVAQPRFQLLRFVAELQSLADRADVLKHLVERVRVQRDDPRGGHECRDDTCQLAFAHGADVNLVAPLRPDVLIGQAVCDVCAVGEGGLARVVATLMPTPWVVTLHAHTLDEMFQDIRTVGEALELRDEAEELEAGLRYRLRRVAAQAQGPGNVGAQHAAPLRKPGVLVLEWLDPPYVAGHWVPELVALAGGQDVGSAPGERARAPPLEGLAAPAPHVVVVAVCGVDIPPAPAGVGAVTDGAARTLLGRRVEFLDGNAYTSRPGPRLVDAA